MRYKHSFIVQAPLAAVREFHSQSNSMGAITPPPVVVQIHAAPALLAEGDEMDFTMWLGPLPIRWLARIEEVTPISFVDRLVDRQVRGPFTSWRHLHTFVPLDDNNTIVQDQVEASLSSRWFWRLVGWGMWLNLPILFAYRAWATKRQMGLWQ